MEPMLPGSQAELQELAFRIIKVSARAAGHVHPLVFREVSGMLQIINSYYSNLIEGHSTHPIEIERAMRQDYSGEPAKRALQEESLAHISVQQAIERRLEEEPELEITDEAFLRWIHETFYRLMPEEYRYVKDQESGESFEVIPGALRERAVIVGRHVAPEASALARFLERFHQAYRLDRQYGGEQRLIAAAAAHHRLGWIHPFLDGNGRVMRLFTDTYLRKAGIDGYGLWTISRGLARHIDQYRAGLARADVQREGDLDGRGNLSLQGLTAFCRFFLQTCLDQAEYMAGMLRLDQLAARIKSYIDLRSRGLALGPTGQEELNQQSAGILLAVLLHGELPRGEAGKASGYAERKAGLLLKQLLKEGLLRSESPKGPVRLGLPAHAVAYLFPGLVPPQPNNVP
jgi:Fic family protein